MSVGKDSGYQRGNPGAREEHTGGTMGVRVEVWGTPVGSMGTSGRPGKQRG